MKFYNLALIASIFLAGNNYQGLAYADDTPIDMMDDEPFLSSTDEVEPYTAPDGAEAFEFEAEVSRMLDIVVNSLYQNKDVFLRELISNASDALDKIRFLGIENPDWLAEKPELEVKIEYDQMAGTLTITDSGIGMTKEDLVKNLGTVARSGTTRFVEAMKEGNGDMNMIGKFGVGFYSTFLVANRVRVTSKHPQDPVQHVWESSNGASSFHIYEDPRGASLGRGTEITLYLKRDAGAYMHPDKLKNLATHYSEFVTHPIQLRTTEKKMVPVESDYGEEDEEPPNTEEDEFEVSEEDDEDEKEPEMEEVTTYTWDQVNTNKPLWTRDKDEISDDEYQDFYKAISKDFVNATTWSHFDAEGSINFKALLYLPTELPEYLRYNLGAPEKAGLNLYVRKVLISDSFELLPRYLAFMKGVVDSDDLPLNVNRETVQESKIIKVISKKLVRKAIEMVRKLSEVVQEDKVEVDEEGNIIEGDVGVDEPEEHPYITWYKKFGTSIKMGCLEDEPNRNKLMKLIRFKTSAYHDDDDWVSLSQYVERMKEWQEEIFYFAGDKVEDAESSHFMDKFKKKGVEVLYLTDPVDEYMFSNIDGFDGKKFMSITKEGIKFGDEDENYEKRKEKMYKKKFEPLTKFLKKSFGASVQKVVVSNRLEKVPALISTTKYSHSANMERILKAQAFQHGAEDDGFRNKAMRVFEINPRHPFITSLLEKMPELGDADFELDEVSKDAMWLLHDVALLNSGFMITNTKNFSKRMTRVLKNQLQLETLELEDELEVPEEEEEDEPDDFDPDMLDGMNMGDFDMSQFDMEEPDDLD